MIMHMLKSPLFVIFILSFILIILNLEQFLKKLVAQVARAPNVFHIVVVESHVEH